MRTNNVNVKCPVQWSTLDKMKEIEKERERERKREREREREGEDKILISVSKKGVITNKPMFR